MRRGEVWWANLAAPAGRRPVLLLSRNEAYLVRSLVTVAPLSTRIRQIPAEVILDREDGVPRRCAANLDSMVTVPRASLHERITVLSPEKLEAVADAIRFALDLPWP